MLHAQNVLSPSLHLSIVSFFPAFGLVGSLEIELLTLPPSTIEVPPTESSGLCAGGSDRGGSGAWSWRARYHGRDG
jgi:hypothetical protein